MFGKLFSESGLSLERLRSLVQVGALKSIARAANDDPVRQSLYSRQIKELEDFFRVRLVERHGKGTRLTTAGRELARISRFFMLGLSNFKRGCLAEEQTFRIGASATFVRCYLLPMLSANALVPGPSYVIENAADDEIERRLHDLTMDFGIIGARQLSRPLQSLRLLQWRLQLWVPCRLRITTKEAAARFRERKLPMIIVEKEAAEPGAGMASEFEPRLECDSFADAAVAAASQRAAVLLPDFMKPEKAEAFLRLPIPKTRRRSFEYRLAWNPRLLRLNPHTVRQRDWLAKHVADAVGS